MNTLIETYQGRTATLGITDLPYGLNRYDGWKFINRANAESLARSHPETWQISGFAPKRENMKWLTLLLTYLPTILATVVGVEKAAAGLNVPGANKKQVVLDIMTAGAAGAQAIPEAHVQGIGQIIDIVVGAFNKSGIFTTTTMKA